MNGQHIGSYDQIARLPAYPEGISELGRKDQAGGYLGITPGGEVLGSWGQRYDTAAVIADRVLKHGELAFTTDTQEAFIGDGETAGGLFLFASQSQEISLTNTDTDITNTTGLVVCNPTYKTQAIYEYRAILAITDKLTTENNWKFQIPEMGTTGYSGHGVLSNRMLPVSAYWMPSRNTPNERRECEISTGFGTTFIGPAASAAVSNATEPSLVVIEGWFSSHLTSKFQFKLMQQATNALGVALVSTSGGGQVSTIAMRRIV